jgi:hypothetical protein
MCKDTLTRVYTVQISNIRTTAFTLFPVTLKFSAELTI